MYHRNENFAFETRIELERCCGEMGWDLLQRDDGSVQISHAEAGYEHDPSSGTDWLFASMARLGCCVDEWLPFGSLGGDQRLCHPTYAEGSDFSADDIATMEAVYARYPIAITWQPGVIAVLENIACTHARPACGADCWNRG